MHDVSDYELQKPDVALPPARKPPSILPLIAAIAVLAAGAALFVYLRQAPVTPAGGVTQTDVAVTPEPDRPLGADAEPIELPPLDETDPLVREMVRMLSSHPRVAAWLATRGLIRNFTASVENMAGGRTPSVLQRPLKPQAPFAVVTSRGGLMIDTRSYNRYNDLAAAVGSIDATGAAQLYTRLKPRIEDAYRDLGHQTPFDRALEASIVALLRVPVVEGDVALVPRGALFQFNDPRLERLTAAQKQLLRMGPRNVRLIQRTLRDIGAALGIPKDRL